MNNFFDFSALDGQLKSIALPPGQLSSQNQIPASVIEDSGLEYYYDHNQKVYWTKNSRGGFIQVDEKSLRRLLAAKGFSSKKSDDQILSKCDKIITKIQTERDIAYAGPLAGYWRGTDTILGNSVLITESPKLIEPVKGDWPLINGILEGQFKDKNIDQRDYLFGWLKVGIESLRARTNCPGQVMVFAGKRDTGKSLLQNLITLLFGGREAKPYQYMVGSTSFNGDLFGAEHQMIEDEVASTDIRTRRHFGAQLKAMTVNETQRCHAKYRTGLTLTPFWRVTISVNDEAENLMILPPLDESLEDKIILLKIRRPKFPSTQSISERKRFLDGLKNELPHFVDFLISWKIPTKLESNRFGIKHFHHPDLLEAIDDLAPENRLSKLIDNILFNHPEFLEVEPQKWEGPAEELEKTLLRSSWDHEVRRLLPFSTACGVYLARLANKTNTRVFKKRLHGQTVWQIHPPPLRIESERAEKQIIID